MPGVPGKEFEIQKRLNRLKDKREPTARNNNNNNDGDNNNNLFLPPAGPYILPPPPPKSPDPFGLPPPPDPFRPPLSGGFILPSSPLFFANNARNFHIPNQS